MSTLRAEPTIEPSEPPAREAVVARYRQVRARTERLAAPLSAEDQSLQSMPQCSPTKWHRAHTTWFFETFLLGPRGVAAYDDRFSLLFNSYYVAVGPRHPRPRRGMLSRPSTAEIADYRRVVDDRMTTLLGALDDAAFAALLPLLELGLAHEEQHQELLLTDILDALAQNPTKPAYRAQPRRDGARRSSPRPLAFRAYDGGLTELGAHASIGFHFDNEGPRHRRWLDPFALAERLLTVGEWKAFADAGGYSTPSLWLSDGFDWVRAHDVTAPGNARREGGALVIFGLDGEREADDDEPLAHVSYFEADALARFHDARLPTEAEWELAASLAPLEGHFLDEALRPLPASDLGPRPSQLFGDLWEWTSSAYEPYPGFRAQPGAVGEYNGKFMINQQVLRGGSCFTPPDHVRPTYRNFWPTETRFQMTGVRLARSSGA